MEAHKKDNYDEDNDDDDDDDDDDNDDDDADDSSNSISAFLNKPWVPNVIYQKRLQRFTSKE